MVYVYWRIFAVARKRQAVLMQGADGAKNKENQGGSDSNSSTLGENADNQRILKDNIQLDAAGIEETTLPLSRVTFNVFCLINIHLNVIDELFVTHSLKSYV